MMSIECSVVSLVATHTLSFLLGALVGSFVGIVVYSIFNEHRRF